jgi:aryl-alcohol dehydrogenase-like predicted oxidoreductase
MSVEMRRLGRDGPEISVVGYGAWEAGGDMWGANESEEQVVRAIHAGLDAGMTWIDTAEVYGRGRSESIVGKAVADRRGEALVFTKVAPRPGGTGFRASQVAAAIRGSLARLGVDHVDLYQLHWPDRSVPLEETWAAMARLVEEGLARHIGLSNVGRTQVERCLAVRHVDSVQNKLSLLHQEDQGEFLPWLAGKGVGYLAYSPLGLGLLTGGITRETVFPPGDFRGGPNPPTDFKLRNLDRNLRRVDRLRPIAQRLGTTVATVALRWVIEQHGVTAAIAGSRNPDHTGANAAAGDIRLDAEDLAEIEAIFS